MSEQISFLAPTEPETRGHSRFAECRRRVAEGCGGHHELGPVVAGFPIVQWICCADCPNRAEMNPTPRGKP
jgi:hypothetical protein